MFARLRSHLTRANLVASPRAGRNGGALGLLRRASAVFGLALVVVIAGLAGSASAAVTGLQLAQASSPASSSDKSVTVSCPAGKQVLGGGADLVGGGTGQVAINDVVPDATLTGLTAEALEDQTGTANNWLVRALANCAAPPPGLERVVATSPDDSSNKIVSAACPSGKKLLGAGGEISGVGGQVVLEDIRVPNLTTVTVQGVEAEGGTASSWLARAYAICANPVGGLERVAVTSPTDSSNKSVTATCPVGKQLVGAGSEIGGGGGQVVLAALTPGSSTIPFTAANKVFVNAVEDETGAAGNWFVRAIAICAATSQRNVVQSLNDSIDKTVAAPCPFGKQVTGGGGDVTGGGGQVLVPELVPSATGFAINAFEDENGFAGNWFLRAYAICVTPLPGQEIVSMKTPEDSSNKSLTVTCPVGKRLLGTAATVIGAPGQVVLDDIAPNAGLTSVTAQAFEDENRTDGVWQLGAYAICANPPPGLELVSATVDPDSDPASVTATCPPGKNLLGTGAEIQGGDGQVVLDDLRPNAALTSVTVTGLEDETGTTAQWLLRSHAICANP